MAKGSRRVAMQNRRGEKRVIENREVKGKHNLALDGRGDRIDKATGMKTEKRPNVVKKAEVLQREDYQRIQKWQQAAVAWQKTAENSPFIDPCAPIVLENRKCGEH